MSNASELSGHKQRLAAFFDKITNYDTDYMIYRGERLVELTPLQRDATILDIGTGTGIGALAAIQRVGTGGSVIGVDISAPMIEQAKRKVADEGLKNIEFIHADIEAIEFDEQSFDAILGSSVLMWMSDIPAVLRNCRRWLKTQGVLAFSCYSATSFMIPVVLEVCARFGITLPNCNEPLSTHEKCRELLWQAGFQQVDIHTEQLGGYLSPAEVKRHWAGDSNWISPQGNPLAQVPAEKLREIKVAYEAEIDARATEQGFWRDVSISYVLAHGSGDCQ